jgi:cyclophilin family peptidyl-prolyl cis-trans isomerase
VSELWRCNKAAFDVDLRTNTLLKGIEKMQLHSRRSGLAQIRLMAGMSLVAVAAFLSTAVAQEAAAPQDAATAQAEFERVNAEWKEALEEIKQIQVEYQAADEAERPALRERFQELLPKVRAKADELTAAAERAYQAAPNQNAEVKDLLLSAASNHVMDDRYEDALRISRVLIDGEVNSPQIYLFGAVSAFETHQYDLAQQYLQKAAEQGVLDPGQAQTNAALSQIVQRALQAQEGLDATRRLWAEEQKIRAAEAEADDLPRVKVETNEGDIVIELFENQAPNSVANFISLVEKGYYDGTPFHRVLPGFMAQGGDPTGSGSGGPGYHIACECYRDDARHHFRGTLSMAHAGRDTGGSQFFLTFVRTSHLDGKHTAFGRVIEGLDVLSHIQRVDPQQPSGVQPDEIVKATVVRKRDHEYQPKTLPATR